jgi:hypothetical protein
MVALERRFYAQDMQSALDRLDAFATRVGDLEIRSQTSGALSPVMLAQIERMRGAARTVEQESALYRLESIALRVRDLEMQSESILSKIAVRPEVDESDPFEIPEFLRRAD